MSELDDFLREILPRQNAAEKAIHDGDAGPRIRMWSQKDPVTLLGAFGVARSGWPEVEETFHWVASRFSTIGIEALVWLTDVGGLTRSEAVTTMRWSAQALLRSALEDVPVRQQLE